MLKRLSLLLLASCLCLGPVFSSELDSSTGRNPESSPSYGPSTSGSPESIEALLSELRKEAELLEKQSNEQYLELVKLSQQVEELQSSLMLLRKRSEALEQSGQKLVTYYEGKLKTAEFQRNIAIGGMAVLVIAHIVFSLR